MTATILIGLFTLALCGICLLLKNKRGDDSTSVREPVPMQPPTPIRTATGALTNRSPLTVREQSMFFRIAESAPGHIVLAQVAFSSLLQTKDRPTRATFDRKVADFVVCTKAFVVLAVIELDDSSHKGRDAADQAREALLTDAGYRVLRYPNVPDLAVLTHDLSALTATADAQSFATDRATSH